MDPLLDDFRDRILLQANPVFPVPHFSTLPELEMGRHRYLLAKDGLYLETRSRAVHVIVQLGKTPLLPFAEVRAKLTVAGGRQIPAGLIAEATRLAKAAMPNEWAGVILLEKGEFRLHVPATIKATRSTIGYSTSGFDPLDVVVDIHSHNSMPAFFSAQDDADDAANPTPVFVAMVLGRVYKDEPESVSRVVVHRRAYDMRLQPLGITAEPEPDPGEEWGE